MTRPSETNSIMYQDFTARRPMEVETYLGSPIKLAELTGIKVPRIETIYALLHHCNVTNQTRPAPSSSPPNGSTPVPRHGSAPLPRPPMNGASRGGRVPSMGPPMRRGPPPHMNGYPPRGGPNGGPNGYGHGPSPRGPPPNQLSRRPSLDGNDLEEFSHLMLYDDVLADGDANGVYGNGTPAAELSLRERELMLRQRELHVREQEYNMRRGGGRRPPPSHRGGFDDDDDDDDDFFDPMAVRGPPGPPIDPDNFDMMSVTSRRNRKIPSASQLRKNPEGAPGSRSSHSYGIRSGPSRNRVSTRVMSDIPGLHDSLMENPMMAYSSNRYGAVDRKLMSDESRTNSLTRERLAELQGAGNNPGMSGAYPTPRRTSISPGDPFKPGRRPNGRPSPPGGEHYMAPHGMGPNGAVNGRPSPPGMMRQPVPRHPPGQGNAVAPLQVEQHAGVSNLYPPKGPPPKVVRSLTGSASASAGSGDSGASAHVDSMGNSAHSSRSSLGARPAIGVR